MDPSARPGSRAGWNHNTAWIALALTLPLVSGCYLSTRWRDEPDGGGWPPASADGDGDGDTDGDGDADGDADADEDTPVECEPSCLGTECGDDGCGGSCGAGCEPGETCDETVGMCVDLPPGSIVGLSPGTFLMGSPEGEPGRYDGMGALDGETLHEVTLTRPFELGVHEVTQGAFAELLGYEPSTGRACDDCPVETVTWHEAADFTNAMSAAAGHELCYQCEGSGPDVSCSLSVAYDSPYDCPGYRLPTEAEWEYAARAGTTTATWTGDLSYSRPAHFERCDDDSRILDPIAWYCGNSFGGEQPVGTRPANPWGLYDMLGNVFEWCHDFGSYDNTAEPAVDPFGPSWTGGHVYRGGSWYFAARYARAAARMFGREGTRENHIGFRVARTVH